MAMATMASQAKSGKAMSSRLMNMKFMQRAAVSNVTPPHSDASDDRPAKRVKVDNEHASFHDEHRSRYSALSKDEETVESKAEEVLARQAEEAGDTKWTLGVAKQRGKNESGPFTVEYASLNEIDIISLGSASNGLSQDGFVGRRSFGGFNTKHKKPVNEYTPTENDSLDGNGESPGVASSNEVDRKGSIQGRERDPSRIVSFQSKIKQKAHDKFNKLTNRAKPPKDQEVSLKGLTSLSGGISSGGSKSKACFTCGSKQHTQKDCPRGRANNKRKR